MTDPSSQQLQADAAAAILRRIVELAPDATAGQLRSLADAFSSVAAGDGDELDLSMLRRWAFQRAAEFADFEVVDADDEDDD